MLLATSRGSTLGRGKPRRRVACSSPPGARRWRGQHRELLPPSPSPRALRLRGPFKGADLRPRGGDDAEGPQPGRKRKWLSAGAAAAAEREAASWAVSGGGGVPDRLARPRPGFHPSRRTGCRGAVPADAQREKGAAGRSAGLWAGPRSPPRARCSPETRDPGARSSLRQAGGDPALPPAAECLGPAGT